MPKCVYCGNEYESPRGMTLVTNDGTINYLCSSKCRKNMKMKRRKVRWVSKAKRKSKEDIRQEIKSQVEAKKKEASGPEKSDKKKDSGGKSSKTGGKTGGKEKSK